MSLVAALYILHFKAAAVFGDESKSSSPDCTSNKSLKHQSLFHHPVFSRHIFWNFFGLSGGIEWLTLEVTWLPRSDMVTSQLCAMVIATQCPGASYTLQPKQLRPREKAQRCGFSGFLAEHSFKINRFVHAMSDGNNLPYRERLCYKL